MDKNLKDFTTDELLDLQLQQQEQFQQVKTALQAVGQEMQRRVMDLRQKNATPGQPIDGEAIKQLGREIAKQPIIK